MFGPIAQLIKTMTSTLNQLPKYVVASLLGALLAVPFLTAAQESLTLSVTPTLFQMSAAPGQSWQSSVRVINSNSFPLTVYAEPVNFAPQGELGQGKFLPVFETVTEGTTLAEWITLDSQAAHVIPAEQSYEIPFTVTVPESAPPGGHFAAILIGTRPPAESGQLAVQTSQVVTSLFFVRLEGEVTESGTIRTFSVADRVVSTPAAEFSVRFENTGNVHLQPQGHITIYNMWGKERGQIPINTQTHFGNVLPRSVRNFSFTWEGEPSFSDIGRYRAEVALAYGQDVRKFQNMETDFWVIPLRPLLITLLSFFGIVTLLWWIIRAYIRRMLSLAGIDPTAPGRPSRSALATRDLRFTGDVDLTSYERVSAPVRTSWREFWSQLTTPAAGRTRLSSVVLYWRARPQLVLSVVGILVATLLITLFFRSVLTENRDFAVAIDNPEQQVTLNAEEVAWQNVLSGEPLPTPTQPFNFIVINRSGQSGAAALVANELLPLGYAPHQLAAESERREQRTVIVYSAGEAETALAISEALGGALISALPEDKEATGPTITIYVGADHASRK
jgi:hypothetical protein